MSTGIGVEKARKSNIWKREEHEHYCEPAWISQRLFEEEKFEGIICDPACGFGTILDSARYAGHPTIAYDIVDRMRYCGFVNVSDFFDVTTQWPNFVTNPPSDIIERFTKRAVSLAERKAAVVFPTRRLNAAHWLAELPLYRVWMLTPRPSMPPGHVIAAGKKPGGGITEYCWLVFLKGYDGAPELRWLRRDNVSGETQ